MSAAVNIDSGEFDRIATVIKDRTQAAVQRAVIAATNQASSAAKAGHWQDRTGNLRSTIYPQIDGWSNGWFVGHVFAPAPYAGFVEWDTKEHDIYPKAAYNASLSSLAPGQTRRGRGKGPHEYVVGRGIALRWVDGDGEHFARMVHHPGTTGKHFMQGAAWIAHARLYSELKDGFAALVVR